MQNQTNYVIYHRQLDTAQNGTCSGNNKNNNNNNLFTP